MKVDIISSPQVRKVGSIPKVDRTSLKGTGTKQTSTKKVEPSRNQSAKLTATTGANIKSNNNTNANSNANAGNKVDINKVKSTYAASKSYKSVNSTVSNAVSKNTKEKVDTYASYRKKKYAERIKTRFDLLG